MNKRVWKPLDVNYLRLYEVDMEFSPKHPNWNKHKVVAARSPKHAAKLVEDANRGKMWMDGETPTYTGRALNILQPEVWEGVACSPDAVHPTLRRGGEHA